MLLIHTKFVLLYLSFHDVFIYQVVCMQVHPGVGIFQPQVKEKSL